MFVPGHSAAALQEARSQLQLLAPVAPVLPCKISPPTACVGLGGWSSVGCSCGDGATGIVSWRGEKQETEPNWVHNSAESAFWRGGGEHHEFESVWFSFLLLKELGLRAFL